MNALVKVKESDKGPTERIHQRNPPTNLFRVISQLSNEQKQALREIGFGDLIDYKILDVPTRLAYWLLDRFDEETCSLDVNGKKIEITREVVRDVLGVPMGEVHVDARGGADFRNPLVRRWKAQFGMGVKRHHLKGLGDLMVKNGNGGWMFKVNFLVLFFSTIGELNKSNTLNLKFLHLLNNEADIMKLDWCTYIIECLIKTKKSWNRKRHYNGPVILLLV